MSNRVKFIGALILFMASATGGIPADIVFLGGVFSFDATDYYYPNFYKEAGIRGELSFVLGDTYRSTLRLQAYAYPMDDNIFEPIVEYGLYKPLRGSFWEVTLRPIGGLGLTRFHYPAPYYPELDQQYLYWVRTGYDADLTFEISSSFFLVLGDRGRLLYCFSAGETSFRRNRTAWLNSPNLVLGFRPNERLSILLQGGTEIGGYYESVFFRGNIRPYISAGFKLSI